MTAANTRLRIGDTTIPFILGGARLQRRSAQVLQGTQNSPCLHEESPNHS